MMPSDELAGGIKARLDVVRRHRPELAARNIVLAGPDQLDGLADRLGETHRIEHRFLLAAAPIAAAQEMLMERYVGAVDPERAGDLLVQGRGSLRPRPDLDRFAVRADGGGGVHRLHLSVVEVARAVFAAIDLDGAA